MYDRLNDVIPNSKKLNELNDNDSRVGGIYYKFLLMKDVSLI